MANIVIVKPVPGRRVLDPASIPPAPLPEDGKRVIRDSYWLRREKAGEVILEDFFVRSCGGSDAEPAEPDSARLVAPSATALSATPEEPKPKTGKAKE